LEDSITLKLDETLGPNANTFGLHWSLDGSLIALPAEDKKIRIYDPRTNNQVVSFLSNENGKIHKMAWIDGN
jgi:hypothetical protein